MLLLEAGFLAIFLGSSNWIVWLFRLLLFRLMFLSGAVKLLSHDPSWRNLTALQFHYWTQPLPTPLAWYVNQLPAWFQRASTAGVFFIELLVPWLIFMPRRVRHGAAWLLIFLQVLILTTGNYAFFNLLAIALCLFLFDDQALPQMALTSNRVAHQPASGDPGGSDHRAARPVSTYRHGIQFCAAIRARLLRLDGSVRNREQLWTLRRDDYRAAGDPGARLERWRHLAGLPVPL